MTYSKPEITVLGDAVRAIQNLQKVGSPLEPNGKFHINPAYDLDE